METTESIRASDSKGMGADRPVRHLSSHPHPPKFSGFHIHLPRFRSSQGLTSLYNDLRGSEADSPHKGSRTLPTPG